MAQKQIGLYKVIDFLVSFDQSNKTNIPHVNKKCIETKQLKFYQILYGLQFSFILSLFKVSILN